MRRRLARPSSSGPPTNSFDSPPPFGPLEGNLTAETARFVESPQLLVHSTLNHGPQLLQSFKRSLLRRPDTSSSRRVIFSSHPVFPFSGNAPTSSKEKTKESNKASSRIRCDVFVRSAKSAARPSKKIFRTLLHTCLDLLATSCLYVYLMNLITQ